MEKVIAENGYETTVVSSNEISELEIYANSVLESINVIADNPEKQFLQSVELKIIFSRAQAIADYAKIACQRSWSDSRPRRRDHFGLVKKASETVDLT